MFTPTHVVAICPHRKMLQNYYLLYAVQNPIAFSSDRYQTRSHWGSDSADRVTHTDILRASPSVSLLSCTPLGQKGWAPSHSTSSEAGLSLTCHVSSPLEHIRDSKWCY